MFCRHSQGSLCLRGHTALQALLIFWSPQHPEVLGRPGLASPAAAVREFISIPSPYSLLEALVCATAVAGQVLAPCSRAARSSSPTQADLRTASPSTGSQPGATKTQGPPAPPYRWRGQVSRDDLSKPAELQEAVTLPPTIS